MALETSVTIGITDPPEARETLKSHLSKGFKIIKLKIGDDLEQDIAMVRMLRAWGGSDFTLRVDANQGYDTRMLKRFIRETAGMEIEFIEQPLPVSQSEALGTFSEEMREEFAADEDLITEADALRAAENRNYGIWNLKLMKSGGISTVRRIADLAEQHDVRLMWGCNDESCISIAAALHAAFSCKATAFLDLDGSFDIAHDVAFGGFRVSDGKMMLTGSPGLGVSLRTS